MQIKKAVITAAARGERLYPVADTVQKAMLPIVDRDGLTKPVIQIIIEEAFSAGIEEICIICAPGDEARYRAGFQTLRDNLLKAFKNATWAQIQAQRIENLLERLHFSVQKETLGYGHAVWCAKDFIQQEQFLLLLGDHLYVSDTLQTCAQQLVGIASKLQKSVTAVNPTPEFLIHKYGTLSGQLLQGMEGVYEVSKIIEKPALSRAELELNVPGIRAGYYLCVFGMHVLQPIVFDILEAQLEANKNFGNDLQLTPALQTLATHQSYLALEMKGRRYDLGSTFGLLQTQLALGLAGKDKEEVLATVLRVLAEAHQQKTTLQ